MHEAMDSLSIATLTCLFEMLPDGPAKENVQIMAQGHHQVENHSKETSLRMAMTSTFSMARHRNAMLVAWGTSPPQPALCAKCQGPIEHPFEFRGVDYCCMQCCHDAGDRRHCIRGSCGCTGFAIKRRQLREHRQRMRVMWQVIVASGLEDELDEAMEEDGCPDHHRLDPDVRMDEGSDAEDPMATQANELSNIDNIVQMSRNMVELAETRRDMKRTRGSD